MAIGIAHTTIHLRVLSSLPRSSFASLHVYLIPRAFHVASLSRRAPPRAAPDSPPLPPLPLRVRSLVDSASSV